MVEIVLDRFFEVVDAAENTTPDTFLGYVPEEPLDQVRNGLIKQDTSRGRFIMSLEVNMKEQTKRPNPRYTLEFKQDAAKLVNEKGYTHQQAADNLGIPLSAMGRWARAERTPTVTSATKKTTLNLTDHGELTRLRRENEQPRMEREILKKAAGIEAKEVE